MRRSLAYIAALLVLVVLWILLIHVWRVGFSAGL